jgi:hypothetical protein
MPLSEEVAEKEAERLIIAAYQPTNFRDDTPIPQYGATPPVPQPGRPPMSQSAVDASTMMLSGSVLTAVIGGSVTAVLWASGNADPVVVGFICAAPAAVAAPILAVGRMLRRAKEVAPDVHHHHYSGHVDQRTVQNKNVGFGAWVKNTNQ